MPSLPSPLTARLTASLAGLMLVATPALAAPAGTVETPVQVQGPSGLLKGTMLAPEKAAGPPVVLIIPGSGPTDRDGNSPLGVKASTYRLLAEGLAAQGVASVRIDKRGMFASGAAAASANDVTVADYAADVHAWAASLAARTGAPCVWVAGHSEGSLVALAAAQVPRDICGLVLISGAGRRLGAVLREQLSKAPGSDAAVLAPAMVVIDKLEKGQQADVSGLAPGLARLFAPPVQDFLIDLMSYDPPRLAARYAGPILVIHGTTDLQVSAEDADLLAHARPGIAFKSIAGVNHVLKAAPPERPANFATYADPALPIAPEVVEAVAGFVKTPLKASAARH
jgi:pimeloyl-ACP methyl ester carboxylesterase